MMVLINYYSKEVFGDMIRKRIIKLIGIIFFVIPIFLLMLSYTEYRSNSIVNDCSSDINSYLVDLVDQDGTVCMDTYLDFECKGFYIIRPYTTSKERHEVVGYRWYNYSSYGDYLFSELLFDGENMDEEEQELIFVDDEQVIAVAMLNRQYGDFLNLNDVYYDIDSLFYKIDNGYGNFIIELESNSD
jgi:hypothetical protein